MELISSRIQVESGFVRVLGCMGHEEKAACWCGSVGQAATTNTETESKRSMSHTGQRL